MGYGEEVWEIADKRAQGIEGVVFVNASRSRMEEVMGVKVVLATREDARCLFNHFHT